MSRGQDFARFNAGVGAALEVEIGPVGDEPCAVGPCDSDAVYRVPWPTVGGDVTYCGYHLARYREKHPDLFDRVQDAVDEDLSKLATRGKRWLSIDEVPVRIRGGRYRLIGVTSLGYALFEAVEPDDNERIAYVLVDRRLEHHDSIQVPIGRCGEFLEDFDSRRGIYEWDDDPQAALRGGGVQ